MVYKIHYVPDALLVSEPDDCWRKAETAEINRFPWDSGGYKPAAAARLLYSDTAFHLRIDTEDTHIRAVNTRPNSPVCQDCCVEFFVVPCPEISPKYVNFEINALGTLYASIRESRAVKEMITGGLYELIRVTPYLDSPKWGVTVEIPFAFFEALYGPAGFKPGHGMKGNFYKCAELSRYPHFACWNPVVSAKPDFHRPECFGDLTLA